VVSLPLSWTTQSGKYAKVNDTSTSQSPFVIDPTKIGPFDRCLVCFTPKSDDYTYCMTCGRIGAWRSIIGEPQSGTACTFHPNVSATTFCVICGKPVCAGCVEREGFSLTGGFPTPQCRECLRRSEELEKKYREQLEHDKVCAKHAGEPAALRCIKCRLPHCESCLYFTTTGWRRKKLGIGPLCLGCFRTATSGNERWISLREAKASGLLRGIDPTSLL
jgi:hypothetical protein